MESWVQNILSKWKNEGIKINQGASLEEIEEVEDALNFKFPDDFKKLYLTLNGFNGLDWQEHMFSFWPLEMIVEQYSQDKNKDFVGFSDFLLASHYIGFRKSKSGIYKRYSFMGNDENELIAKTFEEAVSMINSSSDLIY